MLSLELLTLACSFHLTSMFKQFKMIIGIVYPLKHLQTPFKVLHRDIQCRCIKDFYTCVSHNMSHPRDQGMNKLHRNT